jgi:cytochrome c
MSRLLLTLSVLTLSSMFVGPSLAADLANGEKKTKLCIACHSVVDAKNKVGPSLVGVVGRNIAAAASYGYSQSMKDYAAKEAVWDEAKLDAYLADPKKVVPAGKMAFGGVKKPEDRTDIIAYLKTLTPAP